MEKTGVLVLCAFGESQGSAPTQMEVALALAHSRERKNEGSGTEYVTAGETLSLYEPQFPHLSNKCCCED